MQNEAKAQLSIHAKLKKLNTYAIIALLIILGTMSVVSVQISLSMHHSTKLRDQLETIRTAETSVLQIGLAAMDIIVDKADGTVMPERINELTDGLGKLEQALTLISETYKANNQAEKYDEMVSTIATIKQRSLIDLKSAVETRAADDVFAKLDDDIDGLGIKLLEELDGVGVILESDLSNALYISKISSLALIIGNILVFFAISFGTYKAIGFVKDKIIEPMESIATNNTTVMSQSVAELSKSTSHLNHLMTEAAHRTEEGAKKASVITASVEGVAAAVEELTSSIGEIRRQASISTEVSGLAVQEAMTMSTTIGKLNSAAQGIGDITELINKIAESTNLLALNATIEAARAGEAGKGFAVVATEVKNLAVKTAEATGDISSKVQEMQDMATKAVAAIGNIQDTISDINNANSNVMASVEQQSVATEEINKTINEATEGLKGTSDMIASIDKTIQATKDETDSLVSSNKTLSKETEAATKRTRILIHGAA